MGMLPRTKTSLLLPLFLMPMLQAVGASACWQSAGLWQLTRLADRVLVVEIESVRPQEPSDLRRLVYAARNVAVATSETVDRDLGYLVEEALPEVHEPTETYRVSARLMRRVTGSGAVDLGKEIVFTDDGWGGMFVPGMRVLIFQEGFGGFFWRTLSYPDAAIPLLNGNDESDVVAVVAAALRIESDAAPQSWIGMARALPATRWLVKERATENLQELANALVSMPSGTWADLEVLAMLDAFEDSRLDELVIAWVRLAIEFEWHPQAQEAFNLASSRLRVDWGPSSACTFDSLVASWGALEERLALPPIDDTALRSAVARQQAYYEQLRRMARSAAE